MKVLVDIVGYFCNYFEILTARLITFILVQLSILLVQVEFAERLADFLLLKTAILSALLQSEIYIDLMCHFNTIGHFTAHTFLRIINWLHAHPPTHTHCSLFFKMSILSLLHCLYYDRELVTKKTNCFYFIFFAFTTLSCSAGSSCYSPASFLVYKDGHLFSFVDLSSLIKLFRSVINFSKRFFVPLQVCHNNVFLQIYQQIMFVTQVLEIQ